MSPIIPEGFGVMAIRAVIVIAILALLYLAVTLLNLPIPMWIWTVIGILFIAVVIIWAIKFLMSQGQ